MKSKFIIGTMLSLCMCFQLHALQTRTWEIGTAEEFLSGDLNQLTVTSDGKLHLGYGYTNLGEFAKEIWTSEISSDGVIYFGTGSPSAVFRIDKNNQVEQLFSVDATAVTDLLVDKHGDVFVATLGNGKIFQYKRKSGMKEFCTLSENYVWKMLADQRGNIFAATGPKGKVFRISPSGAVEEWFVSEESNIVSLAFDATGALLAGGSDRGIIYKIIDKGQSVVLHQFEEEEIRSLLVDGEVIYAGVNKQKDQGVKGVRAMGFMGRELNALSNEISNTPNLENQNRQLEKMYENQFIASRDSFALSGSIYMRDGVGRVELLTTWDEEPILDMALDDEIGVVVGVGRTGRVYRIPSTFVKKSHSYEWELLFDLPQYQAVTLAVWNGRLAFVGTANIGIAYLIERQRADEGTFTSQVRDCQFLTRWGNLFWQGNASLTISARTGNTSLPDQSWTDWFTLPNNLPVKVENPDTRFIQIRIKLSGNQKSFIDRITLYYHSQNQRPILSMINVADANQRTLEQVNSLNKLNQRDGRISSSNSDQKSQGTAKQERVGANRLQKKPSTIKKIKWEANDLDGDVLNYRLHYRIDNGGVWIPITIDHPLTDKEYQWNTDSIPDGWYELKVTASDENGNPVDAQLTDERISNRFKVDNRRPEVRELVYHPEQETISGIVLDNLSVIRSIEYSINGGDWIQILPKDGIFDDTKEEFSVKPGFLSVKIYSCAIRATDEEGNIGVETVLVRDK